MPTILVQGTELSVWQASAPTYAQILDALQPVAVLDNVTHQDLGGWVGPRPRVVRNIATGAQRAWRTQFAWPYSWPDAIPDNTARVTATLLAAVQRQLALQSADWTVTITPFAPPVNGALADWASGALSVTQTQDIFPTVGGRLDPAENPVGPTTAATHPGTVAGAAAGAAESLTDLFKSLWPLAAIAVGAYVAHELGAFKPRRAPSQPRASRPRDPRPIKGLAPLEQWDPFRLPKGARANPARNAQRFVAYDHRGSIVGEGSTPGNALDEAGDDGVTVSPYDTERQEVQSDGHRAFLAAILDANPRPPEWDVYAPSTPYPCKPWEAGLVGLTIPGRGGGTVTSCATPTEPHLERGETAEHWSERAKRTRGRKGQVQIGLPGVGGMMPKSRARARIRRAGQEILKTPLQEVGEAVRAYRGTSCPLPYPPGLEFPHVVSRCDPEHKIWKGYRDAVADAEESASISAPESAGAEEFACLVREALERDPRFPTWDAAAATCVRGFETRQSSRKGKAVFSQQKERGQTRARVVASSDFDVSDSEYRDTLRSAERKGKRRR